MKVKASISHDEAIVKGTPERSGVDAAEYLKAAMGDADEPKVLLIALRHGAEAHGGMPELRGGRD